MKIYNSEQTIFLNLYKYERVVIMDREIFLNKSVIEQIEYFNSKLETGMSISKISKEIGISKSITEKFKKNGYTLKDNQLVCINTSEKTSSPNKTTSNKNKEIKKNNLEEVKKPIEKKVSKRGRPPKNNNSSSHSIIMNNELWKELRIYAIKNDTDVSLILEKLALDFLKS
jgi:transposase